MMSAKIMGQWEIDEQRSTKNACRIQEKVLDLESLKFKSWRLAARDVLK